MKLHNKRTTCSDCPALIGNSICDFGKKIIEKDTLFAGVKLPYPNEPCPAPKTIKAYVKLKLEKDETSN